MKYFVIILFLFANTIFGQDIARINYTGNSQVVKKLFSKYANNNKELIIFLTTVNQAPRIEPMFIEFYKILKNSKYPYNCVGVFECPKYYSGIKYLENKNYPFQCILDTAGKLFNELGITRQSPIITRWDNSGKLLATKSLVGANFQEDSWIKKFFTDTLENATTTLSKEEFNFGYLYDDLSNTLPKAKAIYTLNLQEDKEHPLGLLHNVKISPNRKYLVATDYTAYKEKIFDLSSGELLKDLFPNFEERKSLSPNIDTDKFAELEHIAAMTMLFDSFFINNDTLIVNSTMPEVYIDNIQGEDTSIVCANKAVILYYHVPDFNLIKTTKVNISFETNLYVDHYCSISSIYNNKMWYQLSKGYPVAGSSTRDTANEGNPLINSFYDQAYLFQSVNIKSGEMKEYFGKLNPIFKQFGTGYGMAFPLLSENKDNIFITQQLDNYIRNNHGKDIPLKSYFNKDMTILRDTLSRILPTTADINSFVEMSAASIIKLYCYDQFVSLIWKLKEKDNSLFDSQLFVFQKYDIKSKKIVEEKLIPKMEYGNYKLSDFAFVPDSHDLIAIYYNATSTKCVLY